MSVRRECGDEGRVPVIQRPTKAVQQDDALAGAGDSRHAVNDYSLLLHRYVFARFRR